MSLLYPLDFILVQFYIIITYNFKQKSTRICSILCIKVFHWSTYFHVNITYHSNYVKYENLWKKMLRVEYYT